MPTLVDWVMAPAWLTVAEAAALMGPRYTVASIETLIEIEAIPAEQDAGGDWLIERDGLAEYREALSEVLSYGR